MNELDLMNAMTDLGDDFLVMKPRRHPRFSLLIVLAALITILAVGVSAAVYYGVAIHVQRTEHTETDGKLSEDYYGKNQDTLVFDSIEAVFDLKPHSITEEYYQKLSEAVTKDWADYVEMMKAQNTPLNEKSNHIYNANILFEGYYDTFYYLEKWLGCGLAVTSQMKAAQQKSGDIAGKYKTDDAVGVHVYYGTAEENCAALEQNEMLHPHGIRLHFLMGGYVQPDDYASCDIMLALTEENAEKQKHFLMSHYEKEGELKTEELQYGDIGVLMIYAEPEPGYTGRAHGFYCVDGIGYCVSAWDIGGDGDARQMLMDLLSGLN